ncbi:hypothetical protein [Haloferax sp. Q22]|uniref:hypothetical protein n=1 Tax=Haloferax sp. (strain Q22) TaxID=1526048 RepID=UPI000AE84402|nr:hypothetical protein [Haloferax sp. Q22]
MNRVESGIRPSIEQTSHVYAVEFATELSQYEFEDVIATVETQRESFQPTIAMLRRVRKIAELVEDELAVDVGHAKFVRIATNVAMLSSFTSTLISAATLVQASQELTAQYEHTGDVAAVEDSYFTTFYQALAIFIVDCMLFTTPVSYKAAWAGTRFINNRYLYRLRLVSPSLHRLVLSEVHYLIRDIVPQMLKSPLHFSEYLLSVTVTTFEQLWEFASEEIAISKLPTRIKQIVNEFKTFVESKYEITVPELEWTAFYATVLADVHEIIGAELLSIDDFQSPLTDST